MPRNLLPAAAIAGLALVLAAAILVLGLYYVLHSVVDRAESIAQQHQQVVQDTGNRVADTLQQGTNRLATTMETEFQQFAGQLDTVLTEPVTVDFQDPIPMDALSIGLAQPLQVEVGQPLIIQGSEEDRSLNVNAGLLN